MAETLAVKFASFVANLKILDKAKNYQRNDEVIDLIFCVISDQFDERFDSPLSNDSLIMRA